MPDARPLWRFDLVTRCCRCMGWRYLDVLDEGVFFNDGWLCTSCTRVAVPEPHPCPICGGALDADGLPVRAA